MSIFKNLTTRALIAWDAVSVPVRRKFRDLTQGEPAQSDPQIDIRRELTDAEAANITAALQAAFPGKVQIVYDPGTGDKPEKRSLVDILGVDSSEVQKA